MVLLMAGMSLFEFMTSYLWPRSVQAFLNAGLGVGTYLAVDFLLTQQPAWAMFAVGGVFLILAAFRIRRFLRDYPIPESADGH